MISCGKCKSRWTGAQVSHCGQCHNTFSGLTSFDMHKPSSQGCGDPSAPDAEGNAKLVPVEKPYGILWGFPVDPNAVQWWKEVANPDRVKK